jgi:RHS repeat-associated protein
VSGAFDGEADHYDYDMAGNKVAMQPPSLVASGKSIAYGYDALNRLVTVTHPDGAVTQFGYDAVGNRLTKTISGSTTAALVNGQTVNMYDANDRLTSGGHSYDADGNEAQVNGQAAAYDFENHLIALSGGTSYAYDADGNRVGVTAGGVTTGYVVDVSLPYASVVEEYSGSTLAARYDYGDDLVRMDRAGGTYYYLYDGLGSTRQLVNAGGAVTDAYSYDAFGEGLSHGPSSGALNPFLFNAQQFDSASGDYFLRARYYDPSNGRFLSQDPYNGDNDDPISLHRYLYANDDAVNRVDPGGKESFGEVLTGMAIGAMIGGLSNAAIVGARDYIFHPEKSVGDLVSDEISGFVKGFEFGALAATPYIGPIVLVGGTAYAGWGIGSEINNGDYGEAAFDSAALFGGLGLAHYGGGNEENFISEDQFSSTNATEYDPARRPDIINFLKQASAEFRSAGGTFEFLPETEGSAFGKFNAEKVRIQLSPYGSANGKLAAVVEELIHFKQAQEAGVLGKGWKSKYPTYEEYNQKVHVELEDDAAVRMRALGYKDGK